MAKSPNQAGEVVKRGVGNRTRKQPDTDPTKMSIQRDTGATCKVQSLSHPGKKDHASSKEKEK